MEQNKLQLEDTCLTIEQAKELKELGVDMSNPIFAYCNSVNPNNASFKYELVRFYEEFKADLIPTLTNTEMLEMLPMKIGNAVYLGITKANFLSKRHGNYVLDYYIEYRKPGYAPENSEIEVLLRDVLFKIIKNLKTNKII